MTGLVCMVPSRAKSRSSFSGKYFIETRFVMRTRLAAISDTVFGGAGVVFSEFLSPRGAAYLRSCRATHDGATVTQEDSSRVLMSSLNLASDILSTRNRQKGENDFLVRGYGSLWHMK
jgi:hypothetical protein